LLSLQRREAPLGVHLRDDRLLHTLLPGVNDAGWLIKHDMKICIVCGRTGAESPFRSMARMRCSDCEAKSLYRCKKHGRVRKARCQKCRTAQHRAREKTRRAKAQEQVREQIFLMNGDGTCAKCGARVRHGKTIDRGHRCE
jgi:hypothetical protein